jgi:hypothetical protein
MKVLKKRGGFGKYLNLRFSGSFTIHLYEDNSFNSFCKPEGQMPDAKSILSQMAKKQKRSSDSHINQRMSVSPSLHLRLCAKLRQSPSLFSKGVV